MAWDVVIAGAGPAGAIAGLILARGGARVLLLDRARFPRPKLCGDTINPGARELLLRRDVGAVLDGGRPIRGMLVTGEPAVAVTGLYPDGVSGVALDRSILDSRLVAAAAGAGASIQDGRLVRGALLHDGHVIGVQAATAAGATEDIRARVVIAADGHHSRVARPLGVSRSARSPRRWAVGAYFYGVRGLSEYGEMHVRTRCYVGVSPVGEGVANVCCVTSDRTLLRQPQALEGVLAADPMLRERFAGARMVRGPVLLGPLAVDSAAAGVPGLLLAGDAAGFIDPMTGDGLHFAFRGGELAAEEALRVLQRGWDDAHRRLTEARRRAFATKWRFNRTLRALVGAPGAVRAAAAGARLAPAVLARTIRYAGDVA